MKHAKALLVAPPWADYLSPSFQIASVAAYACKQGFDVSARHLHLEAAANLGLDTYVRIMMERTIAGSLSAALLFPKSRLRLIKYAKKHLPDAENLCIRFERVMRNLYETTDWNQYSLVGLTVNFYQLFTSLLLTKWLKHDFPHIRTVLGGVITSGDVGKSIMKHFPQIDWCISGEGEIALLGILNGLETQQKSFECNVPGLMYRTEQGVVINPTRQLEDLFDLPDPDYDHYFEFKKSDPALKDLEIPTFLPIEVSRGCPYQCAFCYDRRSFESYRKRPADEIAASIKRLCKKYQVPSIFLLASTITPECCEALFPLLASHNKDYRIFCEMRADLSKQHLKLMKSAGMTGVQIGIEAFHTPLLKKMNKGTRVIDNLKIMKCCEELGIKPGWYILTEFPTETQSDVEYNERNIDFAASYSPPNKFIKFMLFESSTVYQHQHEYGIRSINEAAKLGRFLPQHIASDIKLWHKDFKTKYEKRNYGKLRKRYEQWKRSYENAQVNGQPLLAYYDYEDFLRIEDYRKEIKAITLEGFARELYLFCNDIKSWYEIVKRFPDVSEKDLQITLHKLFKLKVMFNEDNDWLSLAIHISPEHRRHMPFI